MIAIMPNLVTRVRKSANGIPATIPLAMPPFFS